MLESWLFLCLCESISKAYEQVMYKLCVCHLLSLCHHAIMPSIAGYNASKHCYYYNSLPQSSFCAIKGTLVIRADFHKLNNQLKMSLMSVLTRSQAKATQPVANAGSSSASPLVGLKPHCQRFFNSLPCKEVSFVVMGYLNVIFLLCHLEMRGSW